MSSRLDSVTFECGTSDPSYPKGSGSILGRVPLRASYKHCTNDTLESSVADPDPGSGTFLTPGSGIQNRFFPDPGSDHYF